MELEVIVTPELGDASYLLVSEREAVLVDPQRDAWRFVAAAERAGARIRHVLETHVHNDYVSGALEVRAATGADVAAPAGGGYEFPHRPVAEGDEIEVGALRIVAMDTPGHTPEHVSYVVRAADGVEPVGVFTGGSMIVGAAGRTDLLGDKRTDELTRAQFRSLRRLSALPDAVRVLPTHGAGSFCSAGNAGGARTSTIGNERIGNSALAIADEETFVRERLQGLPTYPAYYRFMAGINRAGPRVAGSVQVPPALPSAEVERLAAAGAAIIDGRDRLAFAEAHIPGSTNVELGGSFSTYAGWLNDVERPLVLVAPEPEAGSAQRAALLMFRIGYERLVGYLEGGIPAWREGGRPVASYPVATVDELCEAARGGRDPFILDVRQEVEHGEGMFPGSAGLFVGDLPGRIDEVPAGREAWVICASGLRASIAASLLDAAGRPVRLVAERGVTDLLAECAPGAPDPLSEPPPVR